MVRRTKKTIIRSSTIHQGKVRLRSNTHPRVASGGDTGGAEINALYSGAGNRDSTRANQGKPMESETPYCANCVYLLHLEGILRCAEYDFLLTKQDLREPIDCAKFLPLHKIKSLKIFTGRANKLNVTEQLVLEMLIRHCTQTGKPASLNEVHDELPISNRASMFDILERLREQGKVTLEKVVVKTDKPANTWSINSYWPVALDERFRKVLV